MQSKAARAAAAPNNSSIAADVLSGSLSVQKLVQCSATNLTSRSAQGAQRLYPRHVQVRRLLIEQMTSWIGRVARSEIIFAVAARNLEYSITASSLSELERPSPFWHVGEFNNNISMQMVIFRIGIIEDIIEIYYRARLDNTPKPC